MVNQPGHQPKLDKAPETGRQDQRREANCGKSHHCRDRNLGLVAVAGRKLIQVKMQLGPMHNRSQPPEASPHPSIDHLNAVGRSCERFRRPGLPGIIHMQLVGVDMVVVMQDTPAVERIDQGQQQEYAQPNHSPSGVLQTSDARSHAQSRKSQSGLCLYKDPGNRQQKPGRNCQPHIAQPNRQHIAKHRQPGLRRSF